MRERDDMAWLSGPRRMEAEGEKARKVKLSKGESFDRRTLLPG